MAPLIGVDPPKDLTELPQWLCWRYSLRNGRETKVPCSLSGAAIDPTDPRHWREFADASAAVANGRRKFAGVGFAFKFGGGIVGIDLDDCLADDRSVKQPVRGVVERFGDCYAEISPSGRGLKVWCYGAIPENVPGVKVGDGCAIEMYDRQRFFTVTGRLYRGAPLALEEHGADLRALYEALTARRRGGWPLGPMGDGKILHGQQHSTLVSIAGTLRARGVCDEAILACLLSVNAKQCERPGPAENIARIVRSTRSWGKR